MSKHCDVCSKYFQDDSAFQGHLAGKKHINELDRRQIFERSIIVSLFPKIISPNGLIKFFQQYGPIKRHHFYRKDLVIEFCNRSSTEILLNKPVWIRNVKLNIKKRKLYDGLKKPRTVGVEDQSLIRYDNIKHIFEEDTTFDSQLVTFLNAVQLTDEEIEAKYDSVCTQLDQIFQPLFPNCKTYKFGSTQIGLGFKECDLDIYMDIGEPISETDDVRTDSWTIPKILKEIRKLMYRKNWRFSNIISIPKARIPIIKFCYVRTKTSCDISFNNSLGIHKSNLIKYCISLDERLRPLVMLIKYWANHFKISGSGRICNHALVLLIIFYLQQPSVNIIPPVMVIQNTSQPQLINGWQVNINENVVLPPIANKNSIPQLLHGFFSFYATFEFKSHVICPIDGMFYTESEFKHIDNLPPCMDRYKVCARENENLKLNIGKMICIQDPIELNSNVTVSTSFSILNAFVQYCRLGAEICTMSSKNDYKDLMRNLLTTIIKNVIKGKFKIKISTEHFKHIMATADKKDLTKNDLHFPIFNMVKDIFEKVFKVQVEIIVADAGGKQWKIQVLSDICTENFQQIIFHCTGSHCVWRNRTTSNIVLDPSLSCLEKEALISDQTIQNCDKGDASNKVKLDFTCTFHWKCPPYIILTVCNKDCNNCIFNEFASYAKRKLNEIIERTLTYMQQFNKCY